MTSSLVAKVNQALRPLHRAPSGLVVAVSGGPDSVALLRALLHARPAARPLVLAHLNHQLRGAESDADEAFVRDLYAALVACGTAALELRCARMDVAAQARAEGGNLEAVARRLRYAWLTRIAQETHCSVVATGHTANDQAETVLHRLLRGTGLKGLRGIAAQRPLAPGMQLVRPLLHATRDEVLAYLKQEGQAYRQDQSNWNVALTRNRIRQELLPLLACQFNPAIISVLGRLAEQAAAAYADREGLARRLLVEAERPRAGDLLIFDQPLLAAAPRHLVCEVFRLAWEREGWPTGRMGFADWDRLAAVVAGEIPAVDLPGGLRARQCGRVVQVGRVP
jgi:tRNA(Ile)-lysidine synthase